MKQTRKIRWLIAHEPIELFLRTAEAFQSKIAELTDGAFQVEIFTPFEYASQYGKRDYNGKLGHENKLVDPMVDMEEGNLEMSQLHITELARWHSPEFFALEMPFIFQDHDHAARVLEGPIGKNMLEGLKDRSPAKGLAFTYSGGFRCMVSDTEISTLDDLKGLEFATATSPVTIDTVEAFGATPKVFHIQDFRLKAGVEEGFDADALETTIPRYLANNFASVGKKFMLNTKHSLFLTSIIISNDFWASLDADTQAKFQEACVYASRLERSWSVQEAEEFANELDKHADLGIKYAELSAEETEKFKQLVQPIYDKYENFFTPGLLDGIIKS